MNTMRFILMALLAGIVSGCDGGGGSNETAINTNADLIELTLSDVPLDQIFQSVQLSYTASVNFLTHTTVATPTTDDANAIVTVNGANVASGTASGSIALNEGVVNTITVVVTAGDGVTTNTYIVEVTRQAADSFAQQAYIKASDAGSSDDFGSSIALSGDTLVVGAPEKSIYGTFDLGGQAPYTGLVPGAGAAYVFTHSNGVWTQQAYLRASNAEGGFSYGGGDFFGDPVALSGDTLVVGAPGEDSSANGGESDNSATNAGAVYVFARISGVWSQQAYLKASNAEAGDIFGGSLALSGDTLVVGARREASSANGGEADNSARDAGAVYVFARISGVWSQEAYLKASNAEASDSFGDSVALSGDTLVVGARDEASSATGGEADNSAGSAGAVYVFTQTDGVWSQQAYLKASNAEAGDLFGRSVALSGDTLAVGAFGEDSSASGGETDNSAGSAGAVYVFTQADGVWSQQAYLKASNAGFNDWFGDSVALSGDTLAVGAFLERSSASGGEADNSAPHAGAAYVFTRSNGIWSQLAFLKASNAEAGDFFGHSVELSGDTLMVGAPEEDSSASGGETDNSAQDAGAVYIFQ